MQIMAFLKDYERTELKKILTNLQKSSSKQKSKDQLNALGDFFSKFMLYVTGYNEKPLWKKIHQLAHKCHLAANNDQEEKDGLF